MNTLPENLINKIMLYVSHPCADIIHGALRTREDGMKFIKTPSRSEKRGSYSCGNVFVFKNETTKKQEDWYESEVVERHIQNKFKICFITATLVRKLKRENYLYLHFNKEIIDGKVEESNECYDFEDASDYSESEHSIV